MLTNAGLVYFKVDNMKKEEDLVPQNFKPLNDFVLQEVPQSVSVDDNDDGYGYQDTNASFALAVESLNCVFVFNFWCLGVEKTAHLPHYLL